MAPKVKITKEDIINTALDIIRKDGEDALNARNIAAVLNCSTQPVFSNFTNMDELMGEVVKEAYELYISFLHDEAQRGEYPKYKSFGMAYIKFAKEEKQLFKLLFMCDRGNSPLIPTADFDESVDLIMEANRLTKQQAQLMHLEMWSCVHGIATMHATSFLMLEWELISDMLTDIYHGLRAKYSEGGNTYECH